MTGAILLAVHLLSKWGSRKKTTANTVPIDSRIASRIPFYGIGKRAGKWVPLLLSEVLMSIGKHSHWAQFAAAFVVAVATAGSAGCVQKGDSTPAVEGESESVGVAAQEAVSCTPPLLRDHSMVVTDATVLAQFPLQNVLNQILATASVVGPSSLELYQRWWDTQNRPSTGVAFNDALSIHCDDQLTTAGLPAINGFPIQCPRNEGQLALSDPFTPGGPNSVVPTAIVNRFDLAPSDGAHCGEYRIVYAKNSSNTGRDFMIFEGVLPNPSPECGVLACRPVAEFWANLSNITDPNVLASELQSFYFNGLPGFEPVIHANHYGMGALGGGYGATSKGQVRTNQFMNPPPSGSIPTQGHGNLWQLREFQLERVCLGGGKGDPIDITPADDLATAELADSAAIAVDAETDLIAKPFPPQTQCFLRFKPVTVKNNPFGPMFSTSSTDPRTAAFQTDFVDNQVAPLTANGVDQVAMAIDDQFNAGQSNSQGNENNYVAQLTGNVPLRNNITAKLADPTLDRIDYTALNIGGRATTQSCAGCHLISDGVRQGGTVDPRWPPALGFVHIDEFSNISSAIRFVFVPHRKDVLRDYLNTTCGRVCDSCGGGVIATKSAPGSDGAAVQSLGGSISH